MLFGQLWYNEVTAEVRELLCAGRFIPLVTESKMRPITIGEAILKITECFALAFAKDFIRSLTPLQYAFEEGGAEFIVH
ncbi:MAG: hypothetical protein COA68_12385, partial [Oceanobacter sp.]